MAIGRTLLSLSGGSSVVRQWPRWALKGGNTPTFVRTAAEAALVASMPDYVLLRPVLVELKRRYHVPEPGKHPYDNWV
jgi:hypothetical protein